jgi:alpha-N-arabinofuranosidase
MHRPNLRRKTNRATLLKGRMLAGMILLCLLTSIWIAAQPGGATVSINLNRTNEPISKYIYGQFIEHLGRSIYGGIWAEMLEDRKFFYPVDGEAPAWTMFIPGMRSYDGEGHPYELLTRSPWMIIGDKKSVSMVTEDPYVGENTPRIDLSADAKPGGLLQERLGLLEGKDYTGRIVLAGDPQAAPIEVSLVWGIGASDRDTVIIDKIGRSYVKFPLSFTSKGTTDNGRIEIVSRGKGHFMIGAVSLMPANNIFGWRHDTVALLKQLNSPVYRWPGGNFVSGYDWKDGIGDPDRRPPRKNPAWKGIEHNDVGIHEFMDLCREINAEPYIAVNTGLGGAEAAAEEIEYVNGGTDTPMGKLRAQNGHPEPWGIKWWAIGNEMYGEWQLGHMPLEDYVKKHNQVVDAMRKVDPTFHPIAVGARGPWSIQMLTTCADHMSLISEHLYCQDKDDVVAHANQIAEQIREIAKAHREYRKTIPALAGKDIRIAQDEWNYWYGPNEYGELGTRYFLQDGLGVAIGLHEFFRNSDLFFMANYAQTVNVIGAIKTTKTAAEFETTGLVLKLYRERFGEIPVQIDGKSSPLDISAALSHDKTTLTVAIVNPSEESRSVALKVDGEKLNGRGQKWLITGQDRWAHNAPGKPRQVDIETSSISGTMDHVEVLPLSVTLYWFFLE